MHKIVKFLSLNICYVIYVLLWIKYWLMWFEILLVFILFKCKKRPNISGIRVLIMNINIICACINHMCWLTFLRGTGHLLIAVLRVSSSASVRCSSARVWDSRQSRRYPQGHPWLWRNCRYASVYRGSRPWARFGPESPSSRWWRASEQTSDRHCRCTFTALLIYRPQA